MKDATLIPGCHRVATVQDGTTRRSVTLWSDTGEVRFTRNVGGNVDRTTDEHGVFRDTGQPDGLRLAKYDSDALISEMRDVYVSFDAEGDVLLSSMSCRRRACPSSAGSTPRKIFLEIDPPTLHLLSLGLLVPDMKRYQIRCGNQMKSDIGSTPRTVMRRFPQDATDVAKATLEIYAQLYQALVPGFSSPA